jgi:nucleotide-binding universal stress UspA family protein
MALRRQVAVPDDRFMNEIPAYILLGVLIEAMLLGWVMRRRGYDGYVWLMLGMFLGPISLPIAIAYVIRSPRPTPNVLSKGGRAGRGTLDVLVGYDGSIEAAAALERLGSLLGARLGRVAIASVMPIDAPPMEKETAQKQLARVVDQHPALHAAAVMLDGLPADALQEYAANAGYELIAVGARGSGWSKIIGSVASELAHGSSIPVLVVDTERASVTSP